MRLYRTDAAGLVIEAVDVPAQFSGRAAQPTDFFPAAFGFQIDATGTAAPNRRLIDGAFVDTADGPADAETAL